MWAIAIQVEHKEGGGYSGSRQLPLFYLDEKVQGITDASHAARIALEIADPFGAMQSRGEIAHVSAEFMGPEQMALCRVREGDRECSLDADHSSGGMATMHEDERGPWETESEAAGWAQERAARNAVRKASHEGFSVPVTRPAEGRRVTTMRPLAEPVVTVAYEGDTGGWPAERQIAARDFGKGAEIGG